MDIWFLLLLWITIAVRTVMKMYSDQSILGAIPYLIYALGLTIVFFVNQKAKLSKNTHDLLSYALNFGTVLPFAEVLSELFEFIAK